MSFETTDELEPLAQPLGQQRAVEATELAIGLRRAGYNLFVIGPSGAGKHALMRRLLADHAKSQRPPWDWCYVHNFDDAQRPAADASARAYRRRSGR